MNNYTLFISDLHLNSENFQTVELFAAFLKHSQVIQADALYILGDLFKFWVGDDDRSKFNQAIIENLRLASRTTPIYLMAGNRDFLLGHKFAQAAGCMLLDDPSCIELYGKLTLLTHGDLLCTQDFQYHWFRKIIRTPWLLNVFQKVPLSIRKRLAQLLHRGSTLLKQRRAKSKLLAHPAAIFKLASQVNATQLIYGHVHYAHHEILITDTQPELVSISLGEWDSVGNVLKYSSSHNYTLTNFAP